ncbi:TIGR03086 family metal-binding protein [Phytoactinopolyspora mesophila]|uniref:TIGR03086 family metal-binding protein n=1 Tax=Phytoactinopolyspora mesophila TaxID=2650750 RepID=UPI0015766A0F|nr:TIGR03086 family metal-binding protein [Phytoactinopolyspora mesophila]
MSEARGLYLRACDLFDARVHGVGADQWDAPTPCTEWDVRQLVNHVTVEDLWVPPLLSGRTMAEVGDAFDGDQLGADPVGSWTSALAVARDAVNEPGAASRTVHLSYGREHAAEYLMQLFADHLVHAWDLAQATGGDVELPADLVQACATWFAARESLYRKFGVVGPRPSEWSEGDAQTRLLAAFGRTAGGL